MKRSSKLIIALFLIIVFIICLGGCGIKINVDIPTSMNNIDDHEDAKLLNEKVIRMIDYDVERDSKGAYSMLYPNVTDSDTFETTSKQIYEYFPVTKGYTWELLQWDSYKGNNIDNNFIKGQYKVEFDEKVFYVYVNWRYNSEGEGFTQFQIVSERDLKDSQKN